MSKEKSARTEPNSPTQLLELGLKLSGSGQAKEAEEAFRAAVAQKPDFAEAWCNLGLVLNKAGRFDEAEEAYRTAIKHKHGSFEAWS